jgi:hypothetical protein
MGTVGPGGTWETEDDMWAWVHRDMEDDDLPVRLTPPLPEKLEGNAGLLLDAMRKVRSGGARENWLHTVARVKQPPGPTSPPGRRA